MGIFDGIGEAQIGKGGFYFKDGRYVVDVVRAFSQWDRKKRAMFIVEANIVWSSNPERSPGMVPSWVVMMHWDAALGHIKGFLAACNGADPSDAEAVKRCFTDSAGNDITEACAEYAVHPSNPLAGVRLDLSVVTVEKKKSEGVYSLHTWRPYNEEAFKASLAADAA